MNLKETIAYYKTQNKKGIIPYSEAIPNIPMYKVIEESFRGNVHLSMAFSKSVNTPIKDFLTSALHTFEYSNFDISNELSSYTLQTYSHKKVISELCIPQTKELLQQCLVTEHTITNSYKLKEKDELTFLLQTTTQYVLIQEIYWKS